MNPTDEAKIEDGYGTDYDESIPAPPDGATYPEWPKNPANHRYTISMDGRGPMVVVRGNTAEEVNAAWQELEEHAVGAVMGNAWAALKAAAMVANGLGATPVPNGAPAAPQAPQAPGMPTPPPFGPNVSVPGAPGFQGNPGFQAPPAPPQGGFNGGGQGKPDRRAEYQQAGWYRLNVPFPQKGQFDSTTQQYGMRKGRPSEGGQFSFNSADKSWYVDSQYAGAFQQFQPMPA